ncbi:hypothetical protein [Sphingopyxis sp. JAI128]|uniref:hypothetical protein n=1 Tax=Sphingopyxis sp. JAI128 TaxID=2723066 RepID=UPI0017F04091|nr:hypothetical protein [Sphingopyxis sp. JAI128]MBB6424960.1 hypothetical protein [Sphingopyxis sp. JAI128]
MMAKFSREILDMTDDWFSSGDGESLECTLEAIAHDLERRVELLAPYVAYSGGATTEQGKIHTVYVNGAIKPQGAYARRIQCADLSKSAQIAAMQAAASSTYECIVANKPPEADLLIWRARPEASRCLKCDGLDVKIYARLAWDKFKGTQ